jgi:hypothetical protein
MQPLYNPFTSTWGRWRGIISMVAITKLLSGLRPCMFSELVASEIAYKIKLNDHLGVSNNTIINIL